jgi:hypothetical protein
MKRNYAYSLSNLYSMLANESCLHKHNLKVVEELFINKVRCIYLSPYSNSIYLKKKERGITEDGQIRYSDHWNYIGSDGEVHAKTNIPTDNDMWYRAVYSHTDGVYIIEKSYDVKFNQPTLNDVKEYILPYREELGEYLHKLMKTHDVIEAEKLYQRCKQKEIFYKDRQVKKVTHLPFYKGYVISVYGTKKKYMKTWQDENYLIDIDGNQVDISCLKPQNDSVVN